MLHSGKVEQLLTSIFLFQTAYSFASIERSRSTLIAEIVVIKDLSA
jgi:hypothetical protein